MLSCSPMTQVEIHFSLESPLDDKLLEAVARAHGIYGIRRVKIDPSGQFIIVEYDASRLQPPQVEAALRSAGIRAVRRETSFA